MSNPTTIVEINLAFDLATPEGREDYTEVISVISRRSQEDYDKINDTNPFPPMQERSLADVIRDAFADITGSDIEVFDFSSLFEQKPVAPEDIDPGKQIEMYLAPENHNVGFLTERFFELPHIEGVTPKVVESVIDSIISRDRWEDMALGNNLVSWHIEPYGSKHIIVAPVVPDVPEDAPVEQADVPDPVIPGADDN